MCLLFELRCLSTKSVDRVINTSSNSSNQRLKSYSPRIVPSPDDEHHSQRLGLDVDLVWYGEKVLLYGPGSRPLCHFLDGHDDLSLQPQRLKQLCPMFTLKTKGGQNPVGGVCHKYIHLLPRRLMFNLKIYLHLLSMCGWFWRTNWIWLLCFFCCS